MYYTEYQCFDLLPLGANDPKIQSDLLGITPLSYKLGEPEDLPSAVWPMCNDIRKVVSKLKQNSLFTSWR